MKNVKSWFTYHGWSQITISLEPDSFLLGCPSQSLRYIAKADNEQIACEKTLTELLEVLFCRSKEHDVFMASDSE